MAAEDEEAGGAAPPEPPAAPAAPESPATESPKFSEAMQILKGLGLHLPADTTPDNLMERICVAGHAMNRGEAAKPPEEEEEEEEPEEAESRGAPGEGEPMPATEEQRPMLMSLATAKTESERRLIEREQERHRRSLTARIDKLVKAGVMPPAEAAPLRDAVAGYTLSLDDSMSVVPRKVDFELSVWEKAAKRLVGGKKSVKLLSTQATEVARPDPRNDLVTEDSIKQRAEAVSRRY